LAMYSLMHDFVVINPLIQLTSSMVNCFLHRISKSSATRWYSRSGNPHKWETISRSSSAFGLATVLAQSFVSVRCRWCWTGFHFHLTSHEVLTSEHSVFFFEHMRLKRLSNCIVSGCAGTCYRHNATSSTNYT
jgi:hypothetical protein